MIALMCLVLLAIAPETDRGYRTARVQLSGPLSEVVFRVEGEDVTRFVGNLAAGEEREVTLPFSASASDREAKPRVVGAGRARIVEWITDSGDSLGRLSRRTRPPLASGQPRAPLASLLLVAAGLIFALGLRRRPVMSVAAGIAVALAAGVLAANTGETEPAWEQVFEGDGESGPWLSVETARDVIGCGPDLPTRVEIFPEGRASFWTAEMGPGGKLSYRLEARAATLSLVRRVPAGEPSLLRERNDFGGLSETWLRAGAGGFVAHGPWRVGIGLPPAQVGRSSPPGWLASGLPQGTPILLGLRSDSGAQTGAAAIPSGGARGRTWVRLVGFY